METMERLAGRKGVVTTGPIVAVAIVLVLLCGFFAGLVLTDTMAPSILVSGIVSGIVNAFLYMLVALGMTILFGMMNIINFAHGAIYMMGAYGVYYFCTQQNINYFLSFVIAIILMGVFGLLVEWGIYRRLRGNLNANLVALLGLDILLGSGALLVFGVLHKSVPSVFTGIVRAGFLNVSVERLAIIPFALVLLILLYYLLFRTRFGRGMRAVSQDQEAAALQSVNVHAINALAFAVSFALAGAAGALVAPLESVSAAMGFKPLLTSIIVIIIGGLGSLRGTILGALTIGLFESIATIAFGSDAAYLYLFIFLIFFLIFRPQGLFGHEN